MSKQNKNKNSNFKENLDDKNSIWEKVRRKFVGNPQQQDSNTSDVDLPMDTGIIQLPEAKNMLEVIKNDLFWLPVNISPDSLQDYDKKFIYKKEQAAVSSSGLKWEFLKLYVRELPNSALFGTWISYQFPVGESHLTILNQEYIATQIIWIISPVSKSWNESEGAVTGYYADNRIFEGRIEFTHKENQLYVEVSDKTSGRWSFLLSQKQEHWEGFQLLLSQKEEHSKVPAVRRTIWQRIHPNDFVDLRVDIKAYRFKTKADLPKPIQQQLHLWNNNEVLLLKQQEMEALNNQLMAAQTELNSLNNENTSLKTDFNDKIKDVSRLNEDLTDLRADLNSKIEDVSRLNEHLQKEQKINYDLNETLTDERAKNGKIERNLAGKEAENKNLIAKQGENDNLKKALDGKTEELVQKETENNDLNKNLAAERAKNGKLKKDLDEKTEELVQKETENNDLNKNLAAERVEKDKLKADFDKRTKELEQKEAKNKVLNEKLAAAKNQNSKYIIGIIVLAIVASGFHWYIANKQQTTFDKQHAKLKKDLYLTPYKPNLTQIDSLVGIWSCDVGSTLVRFPPEPNKYAHNFAEFIYDTNGYFKIRRWGPKYKYEGYAQMESKDLIDLLRVDNQ